jgi:hypothetical protein
MSAGTTYSRRTTTSATGKPQCRRRPIRSASAHGGTHARHLHMCAAFAAFATQFRVGTVLGTGSPRSAAPDPCDPPQRPPRPLVPGTRSWVCWARGRLARCSRSWTTRPARTAPSK